MILAALALSVAAPAVAQTYPDRPITFVVPFSAGGPTDTVTRLIAEPMSKTLGQQIVVQNVTARVARWGRVKWLRPSRTATPS
jgi:tripartite-type tricarboxylate transporter receptor subunit TctC